MFSPPLKKSIVFLKYALKMDLVKGAWFDLYVKPKLITAMKSTILIGLAEIGQIKIDGADQLSFTVFGKKIIKNTR